MSCSSSGSGLKYIISEKIAYDVKPDPHPVITNNWKSNWNLILMSKKCVKPVSQCKGSPVLKSDFIRTTHWPVDYEIV